MPERVRLFEMGPRDGLQNEPRQIATADKIRLVNLLSDTGLTHIEVTSFVSPKWVPQMADAAEVLAGIRRAPGVIYSALTPNHIGFERALAAGVDEVAVFASASEGFSRANINCSVAESLARFAPVLEAAGSANVRVRRPLTLASSSQRRSRTASRHPLVSSNATSCSSANGPPWSSRLRTACSTMD